MLLTITTTHSPATDLGYLLHKNPARPQTLELAFGQAFVFYPEATADRCTAALQIDVDPVALVRKSGPAGEGHSLEQYVNDRPYAASSLMSVALARVFASALGGRSKERPQLVEMPIPLEIFIPVLPARGGEPFMRALFEPLGYAIAIQALPMDTGFGMTTPSPYYRTTLRHTIPLRLALAHLYVLLPVLDNDKHYWIDAQEVDKLLRHGEGWLPQHPLREQIARRYLKRQHRLVNEALARLTRDETIDPDEAPASEIANEQQIERGLSLNEQRMQAVHEALKEGGAASVLDLGCGEGNLLRRLLRDRQFQKIAGMDVSHQVLARARDRLHWDRLPPRLRDRIDLLHGSLVYRDRRLAGFDAAAVVEVIEHLDPPRLASFERVVFEFARPGRVVLTTPNVEYNVLFPGLAAGGFRHRDHRFEWTRAQFQEWAIGVAARNKYRVGFAPVGPFDDQVGSPTQMAVFDREA